MFFPFQSPRPYESDTSDSHSDSEVPTSLTTTSRGLLNNNHHHNLRPGHQPHQLQLQHLGVQARGGGATATAAAAAAAAAAAHAAMTTIENVSMAALAVAALSGAAHAAAHAASNGAPPTSGAGQRQSPSGSAASVSPALPPGGGVAGQAPPPHLPYLANVARSFQSVAGNGTTGTGGGATDVDKGGGGTGAGGGEQPLDLSKGGSATSGSSPSAASNAQQEKISSPLGNNLPRLPTLDTKHIFNKAACVSGGREANVHGGRAAGRPQGHPVRQAGHQEGGHLL
ncbi:unnamed protein product [Acanthoscelides obtectus]|uniref:Uncharacterized protein n=1 Tax=Acanthoscelides obtectus TaxID=200917 RepID=A0A9P0MFW4_ACAOB|nr:unnamed protein product [Acanthoscelides obtectus]CAK1623930.1 hypothetical protein AOBTE_LOCUS2236 [Acanthoscelides obtectus]